MEKHFISTQRVNEKAQTIASVARIHFSRLLDEPERRIKLYGIPRGGVCAAHAVVAAGGRLHFEVVDNPELADALVDDLVDSGATRDRYCKQYPSLCFYALYDKTSPEYNGPGGWLVFPWEVRDTNDETIEDNVVRMLQYMGEDPDRGGLRETPSRVAKAWSTWCEGYGHDPADVLKVFEDGADNYDEMVVVRDIPFYSHCEHHLAPFFGTATVAYIPNGKIVGLSKLSRLVQIYARRLQVQERMTNQIAEALDTHLNPKGVGVVIKARHLCMESRGVCQQGHHTVTCAVRGALKDKPEARSEFMELSR